MKKLQLNIQMTQTTMLYTQTREPHNWYTHQRIPNKHWKDSNNYYTAQTNQNTQRQTKN